MKIRITEEPMHERRFCLDCSTVSEMNVQGICPRCGSLELVLAESVGPFERMRGDSLSEVERMYAL